MGDLTIGEVARRTGVRASALRYYEEIGILPTPERLNGRRRYDPGVVRQVGLLRFAQQAGFTLEEIRALYHGFASDTPLHERWRTLAAGKLRELDRRMAHIAQMRQAIESGRACECIRIEECIVT